MNDKEFLSLLEETVDTVLAQRMPFIEELLKTRIQQDMPAPSTLGFVSGLENISKLLGISIPTARKRLETILRPAVISGGNNSKYIIDVKKALMLSNRSAMTFLKPKHRKKPLPRKPKDTVEKTRFIFPTEPAEGVLS